MDDMEKLVKKLKPWLGVLVGKCFAAGVEDGRFSGGVWIGAINQPPVAGSLCLEGSILKSRALSARVRATASQAIPNATWTVLLFDAEHWDDDSLHSLVGNPERLTIRTAGVYLIAVQARFAANPSGTREVQIQLNGTTTLVLADCLASTQANGLVYLNLATIWKLGSDDYLRAVVYQSSGAALNVESSGALSPAFMAARIA